MPTHESFSNSSSRSRWAIRRSLLALEDELLGFVPFSGAPSTTRGLKRTPSLPVSSSMTEPIGNDFDTLAISDRIWLPYQTQPRWKWGSWISLA